MSNQPPNSNLNINNGNKFSAFDDINPGSNSTQPNVSFFPTGTNQNNQLRNPPVTYFTDPWDIQGIKPPSQVLGQTHGRNTNGYFMF
jgi:hypothetical protein